MGLLLPRRASVLTDGCPMSATLSGRCWNPTAWCAACRNDCCGIETIRLLTGRAIQRATLTGSLPHRTGWATRGAADCPGSASGRALRLCPHRLTPSSPRGGRSVNPLSHKRRLSFCELSAQEMEAHASCARANVTRTHTHMRGHTCTRTHAHTHALRAHPPARAHTHAHTRIHAHARG